MSDRRLLAGFPADLFGLLLLPIIFLASALVGIRYSWIVIVLVGIFQSWAGIALLRHSRSVLLGWIILAMGALAMAGAVVMFVTALRMRAI